MTGIRLASRRAAAQARLSLILLALVALACLLATLPLSLLSGQLGYGAVAVVIGIPCAAVGVVVARRQPGNPLGWLFLMTGILLLISNDAGDYAYYVYRLGHRLPFGPAALVIDQLWTAGLVLFVVIILLFPDGRLPSVFWRWALRVFCALYLGLLAAVATAAAGALAAHPVRIDAAGGLSAIDYPVGWYGAVQHSILLALLALSVAFIGRQVLSWRRSSGERRQQLKWLASGAALAIVSLVLSLMLSSASEWVDNLILCATAALPVSMGVAILRYRLYEIDRIISRTLAYAIVTGLLVGVYAALALAAGAGRVPFAGGRGGRDAGRGRAVQPAAPPGAAHRGPPVQPGPLRRGPDGGRVRGPAQGRGRTRRGPHRPDRRGAGHPGTRARSCVASRTSLLRFNAAAARRPARPPARSPPRRAG